MIIIVQVIWVIELFSFLELLGLFGFLVIRIIMNTRDKGIRVIRVIETMKQGSLQEQIQQQNTIQQSNIETTLKRT